MTTQAIQSPANILAAPVPAPGNSSSSTAEVPFNRLLQREVTERRSVEQASAPAASQAAQSPGSPPSAQAAPHTAKPVSEADRKNQAEASPEESELPDDAAAVSAELLALVASMTQLASAANAPSDAKNPDAQTGLPIGLDAAGSGKQTLADIDPLQKSAGAADKAMPLQPAEQTPTTAKAVMADPAATDRSVPPTALQSGSTQTANAASFGVAGGAAEHMAPSVDAASVAAPTQALQSMQHALNKLAATTTHAPESLAPPVGTPAWDQAVGQKIVWMVAGAQQSASLTLNPPDLGPMQIVLNVSNAQANATFVAPQAEVRQALEAALPRLREMLGDAGIQLGQTNINAGTPNQGGHFEQGGKSSSSSAHALHDQHGEQPVAGARQQAIRQGLGMVDTFA
jgi:flagellar hook-length control protein FliK